MSDGFTIDEVDEPASRADDPGEHQAEPHDKAADAAELARLAALDPIDYDRERVTAAEQLKVRVGTLDAEVEALRAKPEATDGRGVALTMPDPWAEPVPAGNLLDDLASTIRRHVVLTSASADVVALWIAHTHVYERFQHSPRLSITSPVKRCGKSTLLDVLRATCHRPLKADNISASGVFRTVEALRPLTLLIDEADSFLGDKEELRGILNSGFERSGEVIRVVEVRDAWQPIRFATFCPVALAGIGALPGTIEDRAVPVILKRKTATETVEKLRAAGARAHLHDLARKLARWAADRRLHMPADPTVPDALGDREGDVSVPLLAVAEDAGKGWPNRARRALLEVFGHRTAAEGNMDAGALLLRDIKLIFGELSALRLSSAEIVKRLILMEERPWPEWRNGKAMTAPQLARALAPFGLRPTTIRMGNETPKGYYRDAFEEAWARYLTPDMPPPLSEGSSEPQHRHKPGKSMVSAASGTATRPGGVAERDEAKAAEELACGGVAAPPPPHGEHAAMSGWSAEL